jgi:hypothetical protein
MKKYRDNMVSMLRRGIYNSGEKYYYQNVTRAVVVVW